jgi:hypothetical protein
MESGCCIVVKLHSTKSTLWNKKLQLPELHRISVGKANPLRNALHPSRCLAEDF